MGCGRTLLLFIFTYAITNPVLNSLRTPVYDEMVSLIKGADISFAKYKFNGTQARALFENYVFTNQRSITRSMITWYAFTFPNQKVLDIKESFDLEHIYPKKRQEMEVGLLSESSLESLGNKILLEESINIKASDYRFEDKKKIYSGEQRRGKNKDNSKIAEILNLMDCAEFNEKQIVERNKTVLDEFFSFLSKEDLIAVSEYPEN